MQKDDTGEIVDVRELIRHIDDITDIEDLKAIYGAYDSPESPLYNAKKADDILERLIAAGDIYTCVHKGIELFESGHKEASLRYLKKGVEYHDPVAQFYYGLYLNEKNEYQKALPYYEAAAKQGAASACFNAFSLYFNKDEVKDLKKAQYYLTLAMRHHHPRTINLAWDATLRNPIDHRDDQAALEALEFDIEYGEKILAYELEYTYMVTKMSDEKFFELLCKLPKDHLVVKKRLAECYLFGIGTSPRPRKALRYYKEFSGDAMTRALIKYMDINDPLGSMMKAAKRNKASCYFVGKMLMLGSYGDVDCEKAKMYLEKGISKKYPFITNALGHIYLHEDHDYQKAREFLEMDQGILRDGEDLMRLKDLYTIYNEGLGVETNEKKALQYTDCLATHAVLDIIRS